MPSKVKKQNAMEARQNDSVNEKSDIVKVRVTLPALSCSKSALLEIAKHSDSFIFDNRNFMILDVPKSKKDDVIDTLNNLSFEGRNIRASPFSQDNSDSLRRLLAIPRASDINLELVRQHFGASEVQHKHEVLYTLTFETKNEAEKADQKLLSLDGRTFWLRPVPNFDDMKKRKAEENQSEHKPAKQMKNARKTPKEDDEEEEDDDDDDDEEEEEEDDDDEEEEDDEDEEEDDD